MLLILEIPVSEIREYSKSKFSKIKNLAYSEHQFQKEGDEWISVNKA